MSDVLFVHNNFPAQFGFIAEKLHADGHRVAAVASETGRGFEGLTLVTRDERFDDYGIRILKA